jgi:hypothetical protein
MDNKHTLHRVRATLLAGDAGAGDGHGNRRAALARRSLDARGAQQGARSGDAGPKLT